MRYPFYSTPPYVYTTLNKPFFNQYFYEFVDNFLQCIWTHLLPNIFPYDIFYLPNFEIFFFFLHFSPVCIAPIVLGLRPTLVWGQLIRGTLLENTDSPPSSCQRPTVPQPVVGLCPPCPLPLGWGFLCLELEKLPCMLPQSPSAARCASSLLCWQTVFLMSRISSGSYNISTSLLQRYLRVRGEMWLCALERSTVFCSLYADQVGGGLCANWHLLPGEGSS